MDGVTRILIVEDEQITAQDLSHRLKKFGYAVSGICSTGEAAVQISQTDPPHLILMDIQLSGKMTGDQAAVAIRKTRDIPVIYMTAYSDGETLKRVKLTEPFGFLVKPYIDSELRAVIETAIYKHGMELKLRESELRFSRLAEASFEGIGISNQGVVIDANDQLAVMLGYRPDEIIGKNAMDFVAPESRDLVLKNILAGFEGPYEHQAVRKDGSVFPVEVRAKSLPHNGRMVRVTAIRDITRHKKSEEELRESKDFFRILFDESPIPIVLADLANGGITYVNQKFLKILGLPKKEIIGRNASELGLLNDPHDLERLTAILRAKGFVDDIEVKSVTQQGGVGVNLVSMHIVTLRGKPHGLTAIQDITERKRAEEALLKSEQKFSKAFRTSPTPGVITRMKDRRLIEVNESFERLSGYRRSEILGRMARDLGLWVNPKDQDFVYRSLAKNGRVLNQEYRFRIKNGSSIICRYSAEKIELEGEACLLISMVDLTDLRKAEEVVRESESKFRAIIEQASEGFILIDEKGRIIEWNLAQEAIMGLKRADMIGKNFLEISRFVTRAGERSAERLYSYRRQTGEALKKGRSPILNHPVEMTITQPNGDLKIIQQTAFAIKTESGFRIGIFINDITERKQAEQALKESEEKYRYIVERANDGFVIVLDGKIVFANNKTAEISRYPLTKIIGMPFDKFLAPEEAPEIKDRYRRRISGEDVPGMYETKVIAKDGRRIEVEFCIDLIHYKGQPAAFVMIRNITDRKKGQEAVEKAQRSYRLASLGTLAAGISHEINQPLTALKVKVDGLLYWGEKKPELLQKNILNHLQFVSDEADKINQIIRNMRSLIRHEKTHASPVDVNETMRKSVSFVRQQLASHGIELKLRLSPAVPRVLTTPMFLEQVIVNLVQNAMNALDKLDKPDKTITISTRMMKGDCAIEVSDNGPGIPPAYLDRIFDPLFTTEKDTEGKGMGLGLSIVQHFIDEMGGTIRFKNRSIGGAMFRIRIPCARPGHAEE
jgi:PAS domain S-box-containing protein